MTKARLWVALSCLGAISAAAITLQFLSQFHPLVQLLIANVVATLVVFGFSVAFKNSSFYDPYWSVAPIVIAGYFVWLGSDARLARQVLVFLLVLIWGIRLTANWLHGWRGLAHEDWRYVSLKEQSGILWWPLSLVGIHMLPTILVFAGCVALYPALVLGDRGLNWIDGVASAVGAASVYLEYRADAELHRFRANRASAAEVLKTGVWSWCRHPNYLGEIGFWISLYLFGLAAIEGSYAWTNIGPAAMVLLFVFVSIPMIEHKLAEEKPGYRDYQAATFALLPFSAWKDGRNRFRQ